MSLDKTLTTHKLAMVEVQPVQPLKIEPAWATGDRRTSPPSATAPVVPVVVHAVLALPQDRGEGTARMWPAPAPEALTVTLRTLPTGVLRPAMLLATWVSEVPDGGATVTTVLTGVPVAVAVPPARV